MTGAPLFGESERAARWTIRVCPICHGDEVQLAHGRCARECRDERGVIPPMVKVEVMPALNITEAEIERGAEAVRKLLGGDWRKHNGGNGLAELVLRAAWPWVEVDISTKEPF